MVVNQEKKTLFNKFFLILMTRTTQHDFRDAP